MQLFYKGLYMYFEETNNMFPCHLRLSDQVLFDKSKIGMSLISHEAHEHPFPSSRIDHEAR